MMHGQTPHDGIGHAYAQHHAAKMVFKHLPPNNPPT